MDFSDFRVPIGDWVSALVDFLLDNAQGFFDGIEYFVASINWAVEGAIVAPHPLLVAAAIIAIAFWRVGWKFALLTTFAFFLLMGMNLWPQTVSTLALVITATLISLMIGIPLGIWAAKSDTVEAVVRPILDLMQTMPPFVYLIPAAMFFGLGKVPGAIATIVFSMPPAVRLTNLGIRQVPKEMIEAGQAFGCTDRQLLFKVQIPHAMPSIMAGVNQNIMLALSMVVIASMIGAGGLGNEVLRGIQRLDVGIGFEGGLGVVIVAILLDRITQSYGRGDRSNADSSRLFAAFKGLFTRGDAPDPPQNERKSSPRGEAAE